METLYFLTVGFSLICLIIGLNKFKNIVNPLSLFNILWAVVLFLLPHSENFGIWSPSNKAIVIVCIGVISLNLGMLFSLYIRINSNKRNSDFYFNGKVVTLFLILAIISALISSIDSIRLLFSGYTFSQIRNEYYGEVSSGDILYYFKNFVGIPLQYIAILTGIDTLTKKKYKKFYIISMILIVLLQTIQSGGRYLMLNTLYIIATYLGIYLIKNHLKFKNKFILSFFICVIIFGILFLTNSRTTVRNENLFQKVFNTFYSYYAGSVTYCGLVLDKYPFLEASTYGVNFISGLLTPILSLLHHIGLIDYPKVMNYIGQYACEQMAIGSSVYYNAMPTFFFYSFLDFGYFGIIIESFILGMASLKKFIRAKDNPSWYNIGFYSLMVVILLNTSTRSFLYNPSFVMAFVYLKLTTIKVRNYKSVVTKHNCNYLAKY